MSLTVLAGAVETLLVEVNKVLELVELVPSTGTWSRPPLRPLYSPSLVFVSEEGLKIA